jgi:predicted nucleic acid-binding protein
MIILLDTDFLVDLALNREPFSDFAEDLMGEIENKKIKAFLAWHSVSNFYYIISASGQNNTARFFIQELSRFVKIPKTSELDLQVATKLKMVDFEDAMQAAAALNCHADYIISRNIKDYKNSPIPALTPKQFLYKNNF